MVRWTDEEKDAVVAEGLRLQRAGKASSLMQGFRDAQAVLPKSKRRTITTIAKVPWFTEAMQAAQKADETPAPSADTGRRAVRWNSDEKRRLADEAARLIRALEAHGPTDALLKAQANVLEPERRRHKVPPSSVADWYPEALQAAMQRHADAEIAAKAQPAPEPIHEPEAVSPAAAVVAPVVEAPAAALSTMLGGTTSPWSALREHLVREIANIVAEGVMRGLGSVHLLAPQQSEAEQPQEVVPRHVPFVVEPSKPRKPSVLIVGLKGATAAQIEADFKQHFDLRFCDADKSKDHLRSMTEQADTTVAVVDFISHSHTDIIKARSKHFVASSGGMTTLRQQLARLAGLHVNGHAAAA